MHRVDSDGAVAGLFTDGVPGTQVATKVDSAWLNDMQETLLQPLTAAGIAPVKGTYTQLTAAINALIATPPTRYAVGSGVGGAPAFAANCSFTG